MVISFVGVELRDQRSRDYIVNESRDSVGEIPLPQFAKFIIRIKTNQWQKTISITNYGKLVL